MDLPRSTRSWPFTATTFLVICSTSPLQQFNILMLGTRFVQTINFHTSQSACIPDTHSKPNARSRTFDSQDIHLGDWIAQWCMTVDQGMVRRHLTFFTHAKARNFKEASSVLTFLTNMTCPCQGNMEKGFAGMLLLRTLSTWTNVISSAILPMFSFDTNVEACARLRNTRVSGHIISTPYLTWHVLPRRGITLLVMTIPQTLIVSVKFTCEYYKSAIEQHKQDSLRPPHIFLGSSHNATRRHPIVVIRRMSTMSFSNNRKPRVVGHKLPRWHLSPVGAFVKKWRYRGYL